MCGSSPSATKEQVHRPNDTDLQGQTRLHDMRLMVPQEEGIILKDPQSEWKPDDRRMGAWMKLKPEYTNAYEVQMHGANQTIDLEPCCTLLITVAAT